MWTLSLKFRFFVTIVLLAAGALLFLKGISVKKNMYASNKWPSVQGKIVRSDFITYGGGRTHYYKPDIMFSYAVNGKNYTSDRVALGLEIVGERYKMYTYIGRYPRDSAVNIYYDSANPAMAVLEPGLKTENIYWYYNLAVLSVLCGIFLIIDVFAGLFDSLLETIFAKNKESL